MTGQGPEQILSVFIVVRQGPREIKTKILRFTQDDNPVPLLFKEGLGVVDINPSQPPL